MEHTYTLSSTGIVSPRFFSSFGHEIAEVTESRTIKLKFENTTLHLLDGEPDLPVGSKVKVWCSRWFYCESLEYIEKKAAEAKRKAVERAAHEDAVKQKATEDYLTPATLLINSIPTPEALKHHLDGLYEARDSQHRIYMAHWHALDASVKQKSNDAYTVLVLIGEAITLMAKHIEERLVAAGIKGSVAYAYSPREGGRNGAHSPGKDHFVLNAPLASGRLKRESGDALCKPGNKFWGLEPLRDGRSVSCQHCLDRMIKLIK